MKQGGQCVPCGEVEEEDPLDAYMRDHVVKEAEEASPTPICHIPHISHMSHPTFSPIDHTDFPPLMSTTARPHPPTHPTPPLAQILREQEAELAAKHTTAWHAQYGDKEVIVSDAIDEEKNMNVHCYVCKRWGHTKRDCPHKRCNHCGKEGHIKEDCPVLNQKIGKQASSAPPTPTPCLRIFVTAPFFAFLAQPHCFAFGHIHIPPPPHTYHRRLV